MILGEWAKQPKANAVHQHRYANRTYRCM